MARCGVCGGRSPLTASSLGLGVGCIRAAPADLEARLVWVHARSRQPLHLPRDVPHDPSGVRCNLGVNLAVFYPACSFTCLGCQNWHFREVSRSGKGIGAAELAERADTCTACICSFGSDPSTHLPHAIAASALARRRASGRILLICWETNGTMHPRLLRRAMGIAIESGRKPSPLGGTIRSLQRLDRATRGRRVRALSPASRGHRRIHVLAVAMAGCPGPAQGRSYPHTEVGRWNGESARSRGESYSG